MSGKGGKSAPIFTANGTKKPAGKAPPPEKRPEQEIPKNATCIMDCEAAEILRGVQEKMVFLSQDPEIKLPVFFDAGLSYARRNGNTGKPETIKKIFEPLKKHGVSDCEICQIANICPESVDEVFALVPTLKTKRNLISEPLRIALGEVSNLKQALASLQGTT